MTTFPDHSHCCFPTSVDRPWTFCGDAVARTGVPYCEAHMAVAYRPREDHATAGEPARRAAE
jgi:hypothetical protein